jgi:hypothetical protein
MEQFKGYSALDVLPFLAESKKPTVFCDFDGVFNAMPFQKMWVGDKGASMWDSSNWKWVEVTPDPKKHFVWDRTEHVPVDNETYTIRFSTELVANFNRLIADERINFIWLTSWMEHSVSVLNPLLGLPLDTPFLPWLRHRQDYVHRGKFTALKKLITDIPPEARQPLVWIDDVATESFITNSQKYIRSEFSFKSSLGVKSLVLQTEPEYGINRNEWGRIERFVQRFEEGN